MEIKKLAEYIAPVKDFPKLGIDFKDITPLMQNGDAFATAIEKMYEFAKANGATIICGPEARGFIFGCPPVFLSYTRFIFAIKSVFSNLTALLSRFLFE